MLVGFSWVSLPLLVKWEVNACHWCPVPEGNVLSAWHRPGASFLSTYSPGGSVGKASACNAGDQVGSLGREDPLEKEMATHSSTLTWRTPWTEEPGRLLSMGSLRVGHNWATSLTYLEASLPLFPLQSCSPGGTVGEIFGVWRACSIWFCHILWPEVLRRGKESVAGMEKNPWLHNLQETLNMSTSGSMKTGHEEF